MSKLRDHICVIFLAKIHSYNLSLVQGHKLFFFFF